MHFHNYKFHNCDGCNKITFTMPCPAKCEVLELTEERNLPCHPCQNVFETPELLADHLKRVNICNFWPILESLTEATLVAFAKSPVNIRHCEAIMKRQVWTPRMPMCENSRDESPLGQMTAAANPNFFEHSLVITAISSAIKKPLEKCFEGTPVDVVIKRSPGRWKLVLDFCMVPESVIFLLVREYRITWHEANKLYRQFCHPKAADGKEDDAYFDNDDKVEEPVAKKIRLEDRELSIENVVEKPAKKIRSKDLEIPDLIAEHEEETEIIEIEN